MWRMLVLNGPEGLVELVSYYDYTPTALKPPLSILVRYERALTPGRNTTMGRNAAAHGLVKVSL